MKPDKKKSVREILTTALITAAGEYIVAYLTRPQGSDTSDITVKLTNQALSDLADLVLELHPPPSRVGKYYLEGYYDSRDRIAKLIRSNK